MTRSAWVKIILGLLLIAQFQVACGPKTQDANRVIDATIFSVCDFAKSSQQVPDGDIHLRGQVVGFHEFMIYDQPCFDEGYAVQLVLDVETRRELLERQSKASATDLRGSIEVVGKFERQAGILLEYPAREVESPSKLEPQQVDRIVVTRVLNFLPD